MCLCDDQYQLTIAQLLEFTFQQLLMSGYVPVCRSRPPHRRVKRSRSSNPIAQYAKDGKGSPTLTVYLIVLGVTLGRVRVLAQYMKKKNHFN